MKIPADRRQYGKKGYLFGLHLQRSVVGAARLVEIDKIWIHAVIDVINTKNPVTMKFRARFTHRRKYRGEIQTAVRRQPVLIDLAVVLRQHAVDYIKFLGIRCCISGSKYK